MGNCISGGSVSRDSHASSDEIKPEPAISAAGKREPPDEQLAAFWEYICPLGTGGSGETGLFRHNRSGEEVAIKFMKRPVPRIVLPHIQRELQIQADLGEGHVNIVEAKEVILTDKHLCLVMEYAAGNSLTGYVSNKWRAAQRSGKFLSEDEARFYFKQFISAVAYCHQHSVAHRDLKLDNALLDGKQPATVKLCDFGFAKQWGRNSTMYTDIGTTAYMSPEQLDKQEVKHGYNGAAVDVWAAGVLLVIMLLGKFPFDHIKHSDANSPEAHTEVLMQQLGGWSQVPIIRNALHKAKLSEEVMDLLDRILVVSHARRMTIPEIMSHPWYNFPLPKNYQHAEQQLQIEQERVDEHNRVRFVSSASKTVRDLRLKAIVLEAGKRPSAYGHQITCINLRPLDADSHQHPAIQRMR